MQRNCKKGRSFEFFQSKTNSTRTAIPKDSSPDADEIIAELNSKKSGKPPRETGFKDVIENLWISLISFLVMVTRFLRLAIEKITIFFIQIYRIANFCYRKPQHAKELIVTTSHLIKVSYDAEIWSWSGIWEMIRAHLITPMSQKPKEA
ncbi:hypothetical protein CRE_19697 [Caenorhabditis remanei]|uniref:Uncharacterized protein n=1 Tax=Caenorhabditis remanei TaxID=31234 RepID=E3MD70_CAERE|nr:hypothetical protein CRE_19697 [Caenorhabditis remanei]